MKPPKTLDLGPHQWTVTVDKENGRQLRSYETYGDDGSDLKLDEETVVKALAAPLLDALRRNPTLVEYLTA